MKMRHTCLLSCCNETCRDRFFRLARRVVALSFVRPVQEDNRLELGLPYEIAGLVLATLAYHQYIQILQTAKVTFSSGAATVGAAVSVTQAPPVHAPKAARRALVHPRYFEFSQPHVYRNLNAWYNFMTTHPQENGAFFSIMSYAEARHRKANGTMRNYLLMFDDGSGTDGNSESDSNCLLHWFENWHYRKISKDIPRDYRDPESVRALFGRFKLQAVELVLQDDNKWYASGLRRTGR